MGQLKIVCAQLGPIDTNTYILMDDEIKEAIVIDPAGSPEEIIKFLENEGYSLDGVLLTHGHHDHIGGLEGLREHYDPWKLRVYAAKPEQEVLMVKDYNLSPMFGEGYTTHANMMINDKQIFEVTSKHKCQCLYDFPTGDAQTLLKSLNHVVMNLPDEVIVYPGHGPSTTIGEERETNPFVER